MTTTGTPRLKIRARLWLSVWGGIEKLALSSLPRGSLRKRTLRWVDRGFERIRRKQVDEHRRSAPAGEGDHAGTNGSTRLAKTHPPRLQR